MFFFATAAYDFVSVGYKNERQFDCPTAQISNNGPPDTWSAIGRNLVTVISVVICQTAERNSIYCCT